MIYVVLFLIFFNITAADYTWGGRRLAMRCHPAIVRLRYFSGGMVAMLFLTGHELSDGRLFDWAVVLLFAVGTVRFPTGEVAPRFSERPRMMRVKQYGAGLLLLVIAAYFLSSMLGMMNVFTTGLNRHPVDQEVFDIAFRRHATMMMVLLPIAALGLVMILAGSVPGFWNRRIQSEDPERR